MNSEFKEIVVIPASIDNSIFGNKTKVLKVASYSRVSTNFEEQLTSFHSQKKYYTELILKTQGWKLVGTYADEGISGVTAEKRPDFMKLMKHCKQGKIDLIITKSISRFSRNILVTIDYVRKLKAMGIGIYFEKENLNTLEENSEFVMTILASIAQEESSSLSLNVRKGRQMAMQSGKVYWNYTQLYGFRKGADGEPEIIPEHAEIISKIYKCYISGDSDKKIADMLNEEEVPTALGKAKWITAMIQRILQNERYCGDVILQKTYTTDHISKKVKVNNGELPKIHIKNNHPAIVSREIYEKAISERARRTSKKKISKNGKTELSKYTSKYALSEILVCGHCGSPYKRVTWTKQNKEKQHLWRCIKRVEYGKKYCHESVSVDEVSLHKAIVRAINATADSRRNIINLVLNETRTTLLSKKSDKFNLGDAQRKIQTITAKIMELVETGAVSENLDKLKSMNDEITILEEKISTYNQKHTEKGVEQTINDMASFYEETSDDTQEYNDKLVRQIINTIEILNESEILITFKNGYKHKQELQLQVIQRK